MVRVVERRDSTDAVHRERQRRELCQGGGLQRRIRDVDELEAAARRAAGGADLVFERVEVPNDAPGTFCDQLRRFAGVNLCGNQPLA